MLDRNEFERQVNLALRAIPEPIRAKFANVALVIEDGRGSADDLLGLYEGIPLTERTLDDSGQLPDKISLYRAAIADEASEDDVPESIVLRETLWHEIAHYFGFDEDAAERLCDRWEERWRELPEAAQLE